MGFLDKFVFFMVEVLGGYRHFLGGYRVFEGKDAPKQPIFGLTSPYMGIAPPTLDRSIFGLSSLSLPNNNKVKSTVLIYKL